MSVKVNADGFPYEEPGETQAGSGLSDRLDREQRTN